MSFVVVRKAQDDDYTRLQAAGLAFLARHENDSWAMRGAARDCSEGGNAAHIAYQATYEHDANFPEGPRLLRLWRACARRALRDGKSDEIAWGSAGYSTLG